MTIQPAARTPLRRAVIIGAPGVVLGDIGTSPIYTFRECLKSSGNAGNEAVLGLLSLVFWALMVVVTTKYVCFVMGADNDCEGGNHRSPGSRLRGRGRPNSGRQGPRLERLFMPQSGPLPRLCPNALAAHSAMEWERFCTSTDRRLVILFALQPAFRLRDKAAPST
jgi:hypothetical protein